MTDIQARARAELEDNPTITVYRFTGGVERRWHPYPFAGMRNAFRQLSEAASSSAAAFQPFVETLRQGGIKPWLI